MRFGVPREQHHAKLVGLLGALLGLFSGPRGWAPEPAKVRLVDSNVEQCRQDDVHGWVAELPKNGRCPLPASSWRLRSFPLNDGARMLCGYEWRSAEKPTREGLPEGLTYRPDCMAVGLDFKQRPLVPQPDLKTYDDLAEIQDAYLGALDAPLSIPSLQRKPIDPSFPTLALIDALPVQAEGPQRGALQHGNSLATMAMLFGGCDRAPCRFRFGWSEPALFPDINGEVVGAPLDTAAAIRAALGDFRASESEHLVLSVGLGFEADAECGSTQDSPVVAALRESIRRAACEADAIVLAPAGNVRGDDVTVGMLYPAAFEAEELMCDGVPQGRPLVNAVSGVDLASRPLDSSRAFAPLMTIGGPWAFQGDEPSEDLSPRAASSVAVAAAGPIVSVAWWLRPDLSAASLLEALASLGAPTNPVVEGSTVIKACATFAGLCADPTVGRCSELENLCPWSVAGVQSEPAEVTPGQPVFEPTTPGWTEPSSCTGRGQRIEPSGPGE